jgi:hypothetical protein
MSYSEVCKGDLRTAFIWTSYCLGSLSNMIKEGINRELIEL